MRGHGEDVLVRGHQWPDSARDPDEILAEINRDYAAVANDALIAKVTETSTDTIGIRLLNGHAYTQQLG